MVDREATTDDTMTTDVPPTVETAPVPVPPPSSAAPVDEVLRWLANVVTMAGTPDSVDISTTTQYVDVALPNDHTFARWGAMIGAMPHPTHYDALGATIEAVTRRSDTWSVIIHAHVRPTS